MVRRLAVSRYCQLMRQLDEFVCEEKPSLIQQSLQLTEKGKKREDENLEKEVDVMDSFGICMVRRRRGR